MERSGHVQLRPHEAHELAPKDGGEDRIVVGDDGLRWTMKTHDVGEERLCHRLDGVRVAEGDEVEVLAEAVDDGEDDRFAVDAGQCFNEVEADIRQDDGRDGQGHEQACRV